MDPQAADAHIHDVRLAGFAANPYRWRLPTAELTEDEKQEALRRWPTTESAVAELCDGLATTRLAQQATLEASRYAECFVLAEALPRAVNFRPVSQQVRRCYDLGLQAAKAQGDRDWEAVICTRLGMLSAADNDTTDATHWYTQAYDLHQATGHQLGLASVCECWARVEIELENYQHATELSELARQIFDDAEHGRGVAMADRRLALLDVRQGRPEQAIGRYADLIDLFESWGDEVVAAKIRAEYAQALIAANRVPAAFDQITVVARAFAAYGAARDIIRMEEVRAEAYTQLGDHPRAREALLSAYRQYALSGDLTHADRLAARLAGD